MKLIQRHFVREERGSIMGLNEENWERQGLRATNRGEKGWVGGTHTERVAFPSATFPSGQTSKWRVVPEEKNGWGNEWKCYLGAVGLFPETVTQPLSLLKPRGINRAGGETFRMQSKFCKECRPDYQIGRIGLWAPHFLGAP